MKPHIVLIVDDQPQNLNAIVQHFRKLTHPYEVYQTTSGRQAFHIAHEEQPDLIITDWDMPDLDGIELIKQLKSDPVTADIPVIMCTGVMTSSKNLDTALNAGAADYIRKPVDPIELIARTRSMVKMGEMIKTIKEQNHALRQSYARMEKMSRTDPLTSLSNRRDLDERLIEEKATADRHGHSFSLILCDIDRFKQFNDRYGHECGDYVLTSTAKLLRQGVRTSDHVGRWGGEEFLVVLPETDTASAQIIAEKLRNKIDHQEHHYHEHTLSVTVTFGIATYRRGEAIEATLIRADMALYEGKASGRNRVVTS
jgi:diguanylate cyclase (GGDEF)-like protein